jgi:hypothetical protein
MRHSWADLAHDGDARSADEAREIAPVRLLGASAPMESLAAAGLVAGTKKAAVQAAFVAEGEGFEPSEPETRLSGLANRRTRPDYATLPTGAKGGTRTPTRVNRTTP